MTDLSKIVKPLDLSNLLKYAYLSGFVAAKDIPGHEPYDGRKSWLDFDPTPCPAYGRILSAIDIDALIRAGIEEGLRMGAQRCEASDILWSAIAYDNRQAMRDDNSASSKSSVSAELAETIRALSTSPEALTAAVERVKGGE